MLERVRERLERIMAKVNPCEAFSEDSLGWRIVCTLFPACFCCAGMRGIIYGIMLYAFVREFLWGFL